MDAQLAAAGGMRLAELGVVDAEDAGFLEELGDWWEARLLPALLAHFGVEAPQDAPRAELGARPHVRLVAAEPGTAALHMRTVLMKLQAGEHLDGQSFGYAPLLITQASQLQAPGSGRYTREVELELPAGMDYTAGGRGGPQRQHACCIAMSALRGGG